MTDRRIQNYKSRILSRVLQGVTDYKEVPSLFFSDLSLLKIDYNKLALCSFCKITVYTYDFWRYFNK